MGFLKRLAMIIISFFMFVGSFLLLLFFDLLDVQSINNMVNLLYSDKRLQLIAAIFGGILIAINFIIYRLLFMNRDRANVIAFDNPSGRVSVSIGALEDLIKRVIGGLSEITEVKSSMIVSKKGLKIRMKLIVASEISIPEITSRVQSLIKKKIQNTIGMDEDVDVAVHVDKILSGYVQEKGLEPKQNLEENIEPGIPFQGYRA